MAAAIARGTSDACFAPGPSPLSTAVLSQAVQPGQRIDLTAITVGGKPKPQLATSLDTAAHPDATITLAGPARLLNSNICAWNHIPRCNDNDTD